MAGGLLRDPHSMKDGVTKPYLAVKLISEAKISISASKRQSIKIRISPTNGKSKASTLSSALIELKRRTYLC